MTAPARVLALIVAFVGLVFGAAALVREVVFAADGTVEWDISAWWSRLSDGPSQATTIAAVLTGLVAIVLLILALRQLGSTRRGPDLVDFAAEGGTVRLAVPAFERALCRRLEAQVPGLKAQELELGKTGAGWSARVRAELPARDLAGLQRRAQALLTADLAAIGGMRLETLDLAAVRLTATPDEAPAAAPTAQPATLTVTSGSESVEVAAASPPADAAPASASAEAAPALPPAGVVPEPPAAAAPDAAPDSPSAAAAPDPPAPEDSEDPG